MGVNRVEFHRVLYIAVFVEVEGIAADEGCSGVVEAEFDGE